MLSRMLCIATGLLFCVQPAFSQGGIAKIEGKWSHDRTGQTIFIVPNAFGWDANLDWVGQASITRDSTAGGNIKVEANREAEVLSCVIFTCR